MQITYKRTDLLVTLIESKRPQAISDLNTYYRNLYEALSKLFRIDLESEPVNSESAMFWHGIMNSVNMISQMRMPLGDGIGEFGLIISRYAARGLEEEARTAFRTIGPSLRTTIEQLNQFAHLNFNALYGDVNQEFQSKDLLEIGFNDSEKPDISDYY